MMSKGVLSRRTILRGLGATIALPLLDAMIPAGGLARAAESIAAAGTSAAGASAAASAAAPVRMAMFFLPNGMRMPAWTPTTEGADFELPESLVPLEKVRDKITVLSGLALDNARAKGDGPGDHARSAAAFLTGAHPYKTRGKDIRLGISVDQLAAKKVGSKTRLPSLELGLDGSQTVGDCDSGYSCAYVSNIAWAGESQPLPHEVNPAALFDRLFGSPDERAAAENRAKRLRYRKSILDFVAEDARRLDRSLGKSDHQKLDEFTTSIREIEKRVEAARLEQQRAAEQKKPFEPTVARPDGIPGDFAEHMKLMCDMLVLAFQMDVTRISTLMIARDGSDRAYREIGLSEGHHTLSHHQRRPEKLEAIGKINLYHMKQFAYFLEKLNSIKEGDGTLLDNSMIMLGSGIGDGDRHNHDDLPILLAGRGGGAVSPGRHIRYPRATPLCNLYLSMLEPMGIDADRFGDSTGKLAGLSA